MSAVYPEPTVLAGDWTDDDGQVIDSLVQPQNNPLPPPIQASVVPITDRPKRTTRLISGSLSLDPAWKPVQILPADPCRTRLVICNNSSSQQSVAWITDDGSKAASGVAGYLEGGSFFPLILDGHTGPVVVYATSASPSDLVALTWWAVTE